MEGETEPEAARRASRERYELHCATFSSIEGVASLAALYGSFPSFHDSEVLDLKLSRSGTSVLRISDPYPDIFGANRLIVSFEIEDLIDLEIDGFSPPNVLFGLYVTPLQPDPAREPYYARPRKDGDRRIELEPTVGIGGTLVCGGLKVTWEREE